MGSYLDLDLLSEEVDQTGPPLLAGFVLGNLYTVFELFPWSFLWPLPSPRAEEGSVQPDPGQSSGVGGQDREEGPVAGHGEDIQSPAKHGGHQAR